LCGLKPAPTLIVLIVEVEARTYPARLREAAW
jgi:hypothetical protein